MVGEFWAGEKGVKWTQIDAHHPRHFITVTCIHWSMVRKVTIKWSNAGPPKNAANGRRLSPRAQVRALGHQWSLQPLK